MIILELHSKQKMKTFYLFITLLCASSSFIGQDSYQDQFSVFFKAKDTLSQKKILQEWTTSNPNDPELFTSYFNYYFQLSKQEIISLDSIAGKNESLQILDSADQTKGYFVSKTVFNSKTLEKAFNKINTGIKMYPTRLDMRFGKVYALSKNENWAAFTDEIIKAIDYSHEINNKWTWTNNTPIEDAENVFLESIQGYQNQLYDTENDSLLKNMRQIALAILKHYPNHVVSLSNVSITYLLTKQYDKALTPLLKAETIDPEDAIVLNNIAHAYKLKGDKKKSIEYYKKSIEFGDEWSKNFARQQIKKLEE